jgi:7-keto-8-aminopelargonate synthetase-like enzyme
VELAKKHNASVLVDDAHGLGVLGNNGSGTANHFGLDGEVEVIVGTFSRSLASVGGFVAGSKEIINFLQHNARSMIFSASLPPASAASVIAALDVIKEEPEIIDKLWDNTNYAIKLFKELGIDVGKSETPIIPVYIRDNQKVFLITKYAFENGIFVNPVISPAVRPEDSLLRFSLMATHTFEQIERAVEVIYQTGKEVGIEW